MGFPRLVKRIFRKLGYEVDYVGRKPAAAPAVTGEPVSAYVENPEPGPVDFHEKVEREARGEPFEWPNIIALNRAAAALVGEAKRIVEIGGGTGCFAYEVAADPTRSVLSTEIDAEASAWASAHRARPNIRYVNRPPTKEDGPFDLVVAIEVIEHVADFRSLLRACATLAPRALISTPNRLRGPKFDLAGPPPSSKHVREWTAGEFYWVLRGYWRDVRLFGQPDPYAPTVVPMRITDQLSPVIGDCREPLGR